MTSLESETSDVLETWTNQPDRFIFKYDNKKSIEKSLRQHTPWKDWIVLVT